jgi:hypothetical protein
MNDTPTPRTDAEHDRICESWGSKACDYDKMKDFSCQLERELTEVTKQRDALAEALRVATAYPLTESWYKQAMEALATLKP